MPKRFSNGCRLSGKVEKAATIKIFKADNEAVACCAYQFETAKFEALQSICLDSSFFPDLIQGNDHRSLR